MIKILSILTLLVFSTTFALANNSFGGVSDFVGQIKSTLSSTMLLIYLIVFIAPMSIAVGMSVYGYGEVKKKADDRQSEMEFGDWGKVLIYSLGGVFIGYAVIAVFAYVAYSSGGSLSQGMTTVLGLNAQFWKDIFGLSGGSTIYSTLLTGTSSTGLGQVSSFVYSVGGTVISVLGLIPLVVAALPLAGVYFAFHLGYSKGKEKLEQEGKQGDAPIWQVLSKGLMHIIAALIVTGGILVSFSLLLFNDLVTIFQAVTAFYASLGA
jgi:magnesium-transporting ATPase (P-type)